VTVEAVEPGDVVRFEEGEGRHWFYGLVDRLGPDGSLWCRVVDAQSWADLALEGILPGRIVRMPGDRVLSVVRPAAR